MLCKIENITAACSFDNSYVRCSEHGDLNLDRLSHKSKTKDYRSYLQRNDATLLGERKSEIHNRYDTISASMLRTF